MLRRESGQATLELALGLPVVLVLVGAVVQIGLLAGDQVRLEHAAREAARAATVGSDPRVIRKAADSGGLEGLRITISPSADRRIQGEPVVVRIAYSPPTYVPLLGGLLSPDMYATAQMRIEKP